MGVVPQTVRTFVGILAPAALIGLISISAAAASERSTQASDGPKSSSAEPGWAWSTGELLPEPHRRDRVEFGSDIDSDGNRVIVGAPEADDDHRGGGAAYILRPVDSGGWALEARLTAPGLDQPTGGRAFGASVAIDGDLALVGAPARDQGHGTGTGSAHLFARNGSDSTWSEVCRIEGSPPGRRVGSSVDLHGVFAVVGDPERILSRPGSPPMVGAGSVMVVEYLGNGPESCRTTWVEPPDPRVALEFGTAVAIDGDAIAVGAPGAEKYRYGKPRPESGEVTVFRLNGGSWEHEKTADGIVGTGNRNGTVVEISGDYLLTTSPDFYRRVALLERNEDGTDNWGILEVFHDDNLCIACDFGSSIAIDDDVIVIGIPGHDPTETGQNLDAGSLNLYRRSPASHRSWINEGTLNGPGNQAGNRFGDAVSVHGDMVFAGAPFFDSPAEDAGVICSYVPTGLAVPRWKRDRCVTSVARPTAREGHFGASVDIGPATLAIGQPGENTVHVFERNSGAEPGWAHSDSLRIDGGEGTHDLRIGETLAVSGHSVVVGVPYGGTDEFAAGLAYVLSGTDGEWRVDQVLDPPNGEAFMRFGIDVAVSESVIAIAAQGAGIEPPSMGSVFVFEPFSGPGTPWVPVAELTAPSSIGALPSPRVVAADGDTIVACDHTWGGELGHFGACDVFRKDLGGWTFVQRLIASDSEPWMTFGYDVAIDEDTILVGAPYWGHGSDRFQARAYVFERNADGAWIETTQLGRSEESRYDHIGRSVALDGDIAALGAPRAGDPKASGLVAVYRRFGGAGGRWNRIAEFSDPTPEEGAEFGSSIAVHGQEILVGTPFDSEQGSEAGAAALFVRQLVREPGERRLP